MNLTAVKQNVVAVMARAGVESSQIKNLIHIALGTLV